MLPSGEAGNGSKMLPVLVVCSSASTLNESITGTGKMVSGFD
jgi:hypothetical protein